MLEFVRISGPVPGKFRLLPHLPLTEGEPGPARSMDELLAEAARQKTMAPDPPWLDADTQMCACPECGAPLVVRMWILVGDCWRCGASVELQEWLRRRAAALRAGVVRRTAPTSRHATTSGSTQARGTFVGSPLVSPPAAPPLSGQAFPSTHNWSLTRVPPWLISMLLHLVLLLILALLTSPRAEERRTITLSLSVERPTSRGEERQPFDPLGEVHFDVPEAGTRDRDPLQEQWQSRAEQEAAELRMDPDAEPPLVPRLEAIRESLRSPDLWRRSFAARDPRLRGELLEQEGGTTMTEAAVARGLRWLAQHQEPDGRWTLDRFDRNAACRGACGGHGMIHSDAAATSLSLLPFLGAGQTHLSGKYRDVVSIGLRWLMRSQRPTGDLRGDSQGNSGMYAQGQATIVLCEAYGMTHDESLRLAAERAIDFIFHAQHPDGGWRYRPGQRGDTSVLGWQLMALQSARSAGIEVPLAYLERADEYLDSVALDGGRRYSYQPGHPPSHVMTAEALLCRFYLGWQRDEAQIDTAIRLLLDEHPPSVFEPDYYYWYYATQTFHHFGGRRWRDWNQRMRSVLVDSQQRHGHEAGSWSPSGPFSNEGGRLYCTTMAICSLEVYYRHAPIFRPVLIE